MSPHNSRPGIGELLATLAASHGANSGHEIAIREQLFRIAYDRMQSLAQRMIRGYPQVRRWDETSDVVQAAALRLHRALASVEIKDPRHLMRLTALQIRRELLDLARKYASPESAAAHHETNRLATADGLLMKVDLANDPSAETAEQSESWTRLHGAVASLDPADRELFDLVWFMGATQDEIATLTGSSSRTVRRQWEGIKHRLVAALEGGFPT